jgi:hypothetical protein
MLQAFLSFLNAFFKRSQPITPPTIPPEPTLPPELIATPPLPPSEFADRITAAMKRKGYVVDNQNIVYVRGCSVDGTPNFNPANDRFNDVRAIVYVAPNLDLTIKAWPATVDPGHYYVSHRINMKGAAQIEPGQYKSWQIRYHRGDHEALCQDGGPVTVRRDHNEDFSNVGDPLDTGYFGINQHGPGSNVQSEQNTVGTYSAGCLVVPSMTMQREFMTLVKQFPGYKADPKYIFTTTILDAKDL